MVAGHQVLVTVSDSSGFAPSPPRCGLPLAAACPVSVRGQTGAGQRSDSRREDPWAGEQIRCSFRKEAAVTHHRDTHTTVPFGIERTSVPGHPRQASTPAIVDIEGGGSYDLRVTQVSKQIGQNSLEMLAYNGSIPGPTLRVTQG